MGKKDLKFGTKAIHAGVEPDSATGAIMTPVYQTSTFVQDKVGQHKGYEYSRTLNPTRHALEKALAALENAEYGACFGSGIAAIDSVLKLLKAGDEVITSVDLYGGTYRIFTEVYEDFGIKFHFVDMDDLSNVEEKINTKTKLIWSETPTNPVLSIIDLKGLAAISKREGLILGVDNTFATPFLQNPLDLGADIVMHSVTKYLGGHSDIVMGALMMKDKNIAEKIYHIQNNTGAIPGPMDCFLVLRGLKTLHLRMERHCENGRKIAEFLREHPKVDKVYWPGFEYHPNHEIANQQMRDYGGMLSFSLKGNDLKEANKVMESFEIFTLAESLGGVESLLSHPATMSHAGVPKDEREAVGIVDSLIRFSVGVEDAEDLINDIKQALA